MYNTAPVVLIPLAATGFDMLNVLCTIAAALWFVGMIFLYTAGTVARRLTVKNSTRDS